MTDMFNHFIEIDIYIFFSFCWRSKKWFSKLTTFCKIFPNKFSGWKSSSLWIIISLFSFISWTIKISSYDCFNWKWSKFFYYYCTCFELFWKIWRENSIWHNLGWDMSSIWMFCKVLEPKIWYFGKSFSFPWYRTIMHNVVSWNPVSSDNNKLVWKIFMLIGISYFSTMNQFITWWKG